MSTIKSSFKKIQKSIPSNKCHFGHPQFDAIFNCSLSKGHIMIIQQDHPTMNYISLLRYYISSNYNANIPSLIYDMNPTKWNHLISPIDKKTGKEDNKEKVKSEIAWRYDKMNIKLSQLIVNQKMSFIDLYKQIPKIDQSLLIKQEYPLGQLSSFYQQIQQKCLQLNESQKDVRAKKLLLSSIPSYYYKNQNFLHFLKSLRCLTRSSHLFTLLTIPPIISQQIRQKLIFFSDYYLQIGKVGKGYKDFTGSIMVVKEVETCMIRNLNRGQTIWGIKNRKKEFRIEGLYQQAVDQGDHPQQHEKQQDQQTKINIQPKQTKTNKQSKYTKNQTNKIKQDKNNLDF